MHKISFSHSIAITEVLLSKLTLTTLTTFRLNEKEIEIVDLESR
jgi:hypothetical protein